MRKLTVVLAIAMLVLLDIPLQAQQARKRTLAEARRLNAARQSSKNAWKPNLSPALKGKLHRLFPCDDNGGGLCADLQSHKNYEGKYVGHDEPAMVFYSNVPASGNSSVFRLTLPMDPPTPPTQDGTGGTFNPMLHLAFWYSMDLCDTQSAPNFTNTCTPNSDSNIFDNADPTAPDFITKHPGGALMELQFYPPGWVFVPSDVLTLHWSAALTIDSFNQQETTFPPVDNNADCLSTISEEPVNFAFITTNGVPQVPPDPFTGFLDPFGTLIPDPATALLMNPGDTIIVFVHDTGPGVRVTLFDENTRQFGWMTASADNGFAQVLFQPDPDPSNPSVPCTEQFSSFHPMYSTASEHTRLPWTAHSINIAFSDEIGHFEYCNAVDENGNCTSAGVNEPDGNLDADDANCAPAIGPPYLPVAGCVGEDLDFDGVGYNLNWPGTLADPVQDALLHPTPIQFTTPRFNGPKGLIDYQRVGFEANAPVLPAFLNPPTCDPFSGEGCAMPPVGASFYPFYTTGVANGGCVWWFGGGNIPGTTNTFGGSAAAEFGPIQQFLFPIDLQTALPFYQDSRQVLSNNPCPGH